MGVVNMREELRCSIEEVEKMEGHAELIDGLLFIEDRTSVIHNLAISEISTAIRNYISAHGGECKVFTENVALYVNELLADCNDLFLPDVMMVCDKKAIDDKGVHMAPIFIAEVTSDSTKKNDYCSKLETYRKIGVEEYWIVDLQRKVVFKYLKSEDYIPRAYMHPESIPVSVIEDLNIDLKEYM